MNYNNMYEKYNKLIKNTAILTLGNICTKGILFLMTPLLTKWLTAEDYGLFDLTITYIVLVVPFITLDCSEAAFRFLANCNDEDNEKEVIVSSSIFIIMVGAIISIIVSFVLFAFSNIYRSYIFVFLFVLISETIYQYSSFILRGLKQLPLYALQNIVFVVVMCPLAYILIRVLSMGLRGIIYAYAVAYLVSSAYSLWKVRLFDFISVHSISINAIRKMLKFSVPLMPNAISWWVINVSDRTIISLILGPASNAIYAVANKIPNLSQTFFGVFHLSWQENAIETLNLDERDKYFSDIFNKMIRIMGTICVCIIPISIFYYRCFFSKTYFDGYCMVPILVASIIFSMMAQFIGGIYIAKFESRKNGFTTALTAIMNLFTHICFIKWIGLYAAALSTFIAYLLLFLIRYIDIKRTIQLRFSNKSVFVIMLMLYALGTFYFFDIRLFTVNGIISSFVSILINRDLVFEILKKKNVRI